MRIPSSEASGFCMRLIQFINFILEEASCLKAKQNIYLATSASRDPKWLLKKSIDEL